MNAPTDVPHACTDQPDTDKKLCIATRPGFEVTVMREQSHRFNHAFLQDCPHKSQGAHLYYKWKHHASDDWMISNVPTIKCMPVTFARFGGSWVRCRLVSLQKRRTPKQAMRWHASTTVITCAGPWCYGEADVKTTCQHRGAKRKWVNNAYNRVL